MTQLCNPFDGTPITCFGPLAETRHGVEDSGFDEWQHEYVNKPYVPPTEEQKARRRKAATHIRYGRLFQLSKPDDDYPESAFWFNEGSGMWQVSEFTNDEVRYGLAFVEIPPDAPASLDPKGEAGSTKTPLWLVPPAANAELAHVLKLGASKYGVGNWRVTSVCMSTYISAIMRHLDAFRDGEDLDPESGRSHIAHVAANAAILLDAASCGVLVDDRLKRPA